MRNPALLSLAALLFSSCALHANQAHAETFALNATGFDVNTGLTTTASLTLTGTADAVSGAYDLTGGSGLITVVPTGGTATVQNVTLFLPNGTSSSYQDVVFLTPGAPEYLYDNVVYPGGTQLNDAGGSSLDEYGLLFASTTNHYNFFGGGGAYAFVDDQTDYGFNSPLQSFALVDTTGTTAVTPEPSSFVLLGTGLLGCAGVLRKRFAL